MRIEKVGVVGCGLMGSGIAQIAAQAGCQVVVREVSQAALDKGLGSIEKNMQRMVDKGTIKAEDRDAARARLKGTTTVADLKDCDLIVEDRSDPPHQRQPAAGNLAYSRGPGAVLLRGRAAIFRWITKKR